MRGVVLPGHPAPPHHEERHAHHDQGSFVLFKGNWLAYDSNIASASAAVMP